MLLSVGLNHKTAPVHIRERLAFGPDIVVAALRGLREQAGVDESIILSTCNRTEIYCAGDEESCNRVSDWMCSFHGLEHDEVSPYLYAHCADDAIEHLMKVLKELSDRLMILHYGEEIRTGPPAEVMQDEQVKEVYLG